MLRIAGGILLALFALIAIVVIGTAIAGLLSNASRDTKLELKVLAGVFGLFLLSRVWALFFR